MQSLTYDWNAVGGTAVRPAVMLDDETLRDGLQGPSVSRRASSASWKSST